MLHYPHFLKRTDPGLTEANHHKHHSVLPTSKIHPTSNSQLPAMTADTIVSDPQLRSVLDAAASARKQCEDILNLIALQKYTQDEASSQEKLLFSRLAVVRGLNRRAILDVRKTKQETADARHEIDTLHLQLQNLYYEQRHLRGEIALCENYEYVLQLCLFTGLAIEVYGVRD